MANEPATHMALPEVRVPLSRLLWNLSKCCGLYVEQSAVSPVWTMAPGSALEGATPEGYRPLHNS